METFVAGERKDNKNKIFGFFDFADVVVAFFLQEVGYLFSSVRVRPRRRGVYKVEKRV